MYKHYFLYRYEEIFILIHSDTKINIEFRNNLKLVCGLNLKPITNKKVIFFKDYKKLKNDFFDYLKIAEKIKQYT